jgi:putative radical SAM enzyme (TIGR03279 family)
MPAAPTANRKPQIADRKSPAPGAVSGVRPGSLADEAGIEPGDSVLSANGHVLRDVVDLQFYAADAEVEVHIRKANGLDDLVLFEKDIDEDLGLEFERATWDDVILCNNNCFFCFLKGLPKGMRKTLYTKDDDYRLSFLHGNFVTLTNLSEDDWARLEEQRLSPLNVSVHATELDLRRHMLSNPTAPDVLDQLRRLGSLGIQAHTQIVLCPGVNDGEHLACSIRDLGELYPTVQTVSVVPVGASPKLEEWSLNRDGIPLVRPTPGYAREIVGILAPFQKEFRRRFGATIVQCSDEFYVTAGVPIPGAAAYDGFPQYENGIGMVRTMLQDWALTKRRLRARTRPISLAGRRALIGTANLIAPTLAGVAGEFSATTGAEVRVQGVTNTVFGERVNVSGLLCGKDYVEQLAADDADIVILPRPSLDYFGEKFLDSMTINEAEAALGRPIAFAALWSDVLDILEHGPRRPGRNEAPNGAFWAEELAPV